MSKRVKAAAAVVPEYKVIPVTRYILTRWYEEIGSDGISLGSSCREIGEFHNLMRVSQVAEALAAHEGGVVIRSDER